MLILYSTGCPKCRVLEEKLNKKNVPYKIISDINFMKDKGWIEVPKLELKDGTILDFINANKYINNL